MSVSQKDFQHIAYMFKETRPEFSAMENPGEAWNQWSRDVHTVGMGFKYLNPRFDMDKFTTACLAEKYVPAMHGK